MKVKLFLALLSTVCGLVLFPGCTPESQTGCTDPTANNYNADATEDDGSCTYDTLPSGRVGFERTYGLTSADEEGRSVVQTADGGFLVAGTELTKTDTSGNVLFTKPINANSIMPTTDGNYVLAGYNGSEYYKIDPSGNTLWTRTATTSLQFIHQTTDGGYIGMGELGKVIKFDASGTETWTKQLGTTGMNDGFDGMEVRQTTDGGYVAVGDNYSGSSDDTQFYVYKIDGSGNISWTKQYGTSDVTDEGYSVKPTPDGGCIAAGTTGLNLFQMTLIKLDASGNTTWYKTFGSPQAGEVASHVQLTSDGGYIAVGSTSIDANFTTSDVMVVKTNSSGTAEWTEYYGGSLRDAASWVQQISGGGYIITGVGNYSDSNSKGDMYLLKLRY